MKIELKKVADNNVEKSKVSWMEIGTGHPFFLTVVVAPDKARDKA